MSKTRPEKTEGLKILERPEHVEASLWRRFKYVGQEECREKLFERQVIFARRMADAEFRRRPTYGLSREDCYQIAYSALLSTIDSYNPISGAPFTAYARKRIMGAIADGVESSSEASKQYSSERRNEKERLGSILEPIDPNSDDPLTGLSDLVVGLALSLLCERAAEFDLDKGSTDVDALEAYETPAWRDLVLSVRQVVDRLENLEARVMRLHYYEGLQFAVIANLLELSPGRISQIHRVALNRIRSKLGVD